MSVIASLNDARKLHRSDADMRIGTATTHSVSSPNAPLPQETRRERAGTHIRGHTDTPALYSRAKKSNKYKKGAAAVSGRFPQLRHQPCASTYGQVTSTTYSPRAAPASTVPAEAVAAFWSTRSRNSRIVPCTTLTLGTPVLKWMLSTSESNTAPSVPAAADSVDGDVVDVVEEARDRAVDGGTTAGEPLSTATRTWKRVGATCRQHRCTPPFKQSHACCCEGRRVANQRRGSGEGAGDGSTVDVMVQSTASLPAVRPVALLRRSLLLPCMTRCCLRRYSAHSR